MDFLSCVLHSQTARPAFIIHTPHYLDHFQTFFSHLQIHHDIQQIRSKANNNCKQYQLMQKRTINTDQSTSLCDTKFKIVFLGDSGVGKTSIIDRFVRNEFDTSTSPTVGIDFLSRNITIQERTYRLQLWDTAGQQKYKSLVPAYLKDANIAILAYDPTRPQTLTNLPSWLQLFRDHQIPEAQAVIVATKTDLLQTHENPLREKAESLAKQEEMEYFEVSALTGRGITSMFTNILTRIISAPLNNKQQEAEAERVVAKLGEVSSNRSACCL